MIKLIKYILGRVRYLRDSMVYRRLHNRMDDFRLDKKKKLPMLYDWYESAGDLDAHYFVQDIEMANRILNTGVKKHFDIGSRIDGFVAHLLTNRIEVTLLDIRPLPVKINGVDFVQTDATSLSGLDDESIESISSLHAIEHFGLGRYGDPINPNAWKEVLLSVFRVLKKDGLFYVSVPVGTANVLHFNAHREFAFDTIPNFYDGKLELVMCGYIYKFQFYEVLVENVCNVNLPDNYLCGLYIFKK